MICVCGREMTRHDWKNQFVCHRCGRTRPIKDRWTNAELLGHLLRSNEAEELLDVLAEVFEDGTPTANEFKWWLDSLAESE